MQRILTMRAAQGDAANMSKGDNEMSKESKSSRA